MTPPVVLQGLTLDDELLFDELRLDKELLLEELLLDGLLLLNEELDELELLNNKLELLLVDDKTKLLIDELLSISGGGVLELSPLPPPPPHAVMRANMLASKIMCFNINLPLSIKVML